MILGWSIQIAPCKVIQDSIRFWIPRWGFRIPKHKRFQILVSGLPLIFTFRFLGMTSMADFAIEGHVCECKFMRLEITTFEMYNSK